MAKGDDVKHADDDDEILAQLGYVPSFKREFSNLSTISFAFSIMGMCSSISTTFDTPLRLGGPVSVVWCWILGATMCFTLGSSIAEIVSAYPTSGGLYMASGSLVPRNIRAPVSWITGWLNALGQVAGVSSTAYGLSNMIIGAVTIGLDGAFESTQPKVVGLMFGLLTFAGLVNCFPTRWLATMTKGFVFVNVGATIIISIVLLATTPRNEMNPADFVFGTKGMTNGTGGWPDGLAFLFGLLSVQWTMTDYDASAHISEEIKRAQYAAPSAIVIAVIGTGLLGWIFNIVLILCAGPLTEDLLAGSAVLKIMVLRMGKPGALFLWCFVCATALFVILTALQATARSLYAMSRDHAFPDKNFFARMNDTTHTPLYSVGLATFLCFLPGFLGLASPVAAFAIFAMTTVCLDLSYVIPIACRRIYSHHPEVQFKPGPYHMPGIWGWLCNIICIVWTLFICVVLSLPTDLPTNAQLFNYAAPLTAAVMLLSAVWYFGGARKRFRGPPLAKRFEGSEETETPSSDTKDVAA